MIIKFLVRDPVHNYPHGMQPINQQVISLIIVLQIIFIIFDPRLNVTFVFLHTFSGLTNELLNNYVSAPNVRTVKL